MRGASDLVRRVPRRFLTTSPRKGGPGASPMGSADEPSRVYASANAFRSAEFAAARTILSRADHARIAAPYKPFALGVVTLLVYSSRYFVGSATVPAATDAAAPSAGVGRARHCGTTRRTVDARNARAIREQKCSPTPVPVLRPNSPAVVPAPPTRAARDGRVTSILRSTPRAPVSCSTNVARTPPPTITISLRSYAPRRAAGYLPARTISRQRAPGLARVRPRLALVVVRRVHSETGPAPGPAPPRSRGDGLHRTLYVDSRPRGATVA